MTTEATITDKAQEKYVRVNIAKTAKEYRAETTVSVRWEGTLESGLDVVADLMRASDEISRQEIEARIACDLGENP